MSLDTITLPGRTFILGEKKNIGIKNLRNEPGTTLAAATGTVIIYDSAGATTLSLQSLTMSGTTRVKGTYLLTTGAAMNITAAGTYRAVYTVTNGSSVQKWQQELVVKAQPH